MIKTGWITFSLLGLLLGSARAPAQAPAAPAQKAGAARPQLPDKERLAVPSAEELAASIATYRAAFASAYGALTRRRSSKCELARQLLELAPSLQDRPNDRYALLHESREWAIVGQDLELAQLALAAMAKDWEVDELALRTDTVLRILPDLRHSALKAVLSEGLDILNTRIQRQEIDLADLLLESLQEHFPKRSFAALRSRLRASITSLEQLGGGPTGRLLARRAGRSQLLPSAGQALTESLDWLAAQQAPDGSWSSGVQPTPRAWTGTPAVNPDWRGLHDVGVTGLALLAFFGEGSNLRVGAYKAPIARGVAWLLLQQNRGSGLIGRPKTHTFLYNHAVATQALCEAAYGSHDPKLRAACQKAVDYINQARNPYSAWRYDAPALGLNDTSVTGWMVCALKAAEEAGLEVDEGAFEGAMSWLDEITDRASGRIGYNSLKSLSSRISQVNDHFPPEKGEAMTAVGLLCRIFMGQADPQEHPILRKHGELMLRKLPEWDPDAFGTDMYYWYYGSYAMYQLGDKYWAKWEPALEKAVLDTQRQDGDAEGSWDPIGPWGMIGGRVYSTALMAMCLEVPFRYPRRVPQQIRR